MTTPLPSRLRESARSLRASVKTSAPAVVVATHTFYRIAAELEQAADALEAGPLDALLTQILNRRVTIEQRMFDAAAGKRQMPDAAELRDWAIELGTPAATAAQVAQERCPACNGNDAGAPCAFPEGGQPGCLRDKRVAQEGGGVSASAYLAKVEADPRRAAALQRARDRTPGVRACGSNECVAGQRDGVLCANGECDRENGVRPDGVATDGGRQ